MTSDELVNRLQRIYASINATRELDMTRLPAKILRSEKAIGVFQDFSGNLSEYDMANAVHTVIHNIANVHDHLKRWMAAGGRDKTGVDQAFDSSADLQIIKDLSNNDKHGYPPRGGGHSKRSPRLINIRGQMRLKTKAKEGASLTLTLGPGGVPKIVGDGTGFAVTTGDVVDKDGVLIGGLYDIEQRAIRVWESLLTDLGILQWCGTQREIRMRLVFRG